jgi:hypothetical protein
MWTRDRREEGCRVDKGTGGRVQGGQGNVRKGAGWTRERERGCRVDKGMVGKVQVGQGNGRKGAGWTREWEEGCLQQSDEFYGTIPKGAMRGEYGSLV